MESVYHIVTIRVNETSWAHVWRLHSPYLGMGYDMMLSLDFLIGVTKGSILGNISLNSIAPIGCLEVFVHLIPSWMNGISGLVSLTTYLILQFLDVRHTSPSFVPQYCWIIFLKFW
jgi:hypothetical protein